MSQKQIQVQRKSQTSKRPAERVEAPPVTEKIRKTWFQESE